MLPDTINELQWYCDIAEVVFNKHPVLPVTPVRINGFCGYNGKVVRVVGDIRAEDSSGEYRYVLTSSNYE